MNLALWIVAIVLAVAFAASGLMKQFVPKDKLVTSGQGWAEDFSPTSIRLIGLAEILGAIGLVLPAVVHIAPILVPLAAVGLALVMAGAVAVHARRQRTIECRGQPGVDRPCRLRRLGPFRAVFVYAVRSSTHFVPLRTTIWS
jgi:uncharacterized membrane protein YphA (DoxX/SURF4 family)